MLGLGARSRRILTLASGALVAIAAPSVHADEPEPLTLVVHGDLPVDALRDALARDTRRSVVLDGAARGEVITITLRASTELAVTFDGPHGSITRIIQVPAAPAALINDAALLAASLLVDLSLADDPSPSLTPPPPPPPSLTPPPPPSLTPSPLPRPTPLPRPDEHPHQLDFPLSASFFFPLAANFGRPGASTHFDINVLYGRYGQIDGAQIGLVDVIGAAEGATGDLNGAQIGGIAAYASGIARGLQIGGVFSSAARVEGLQIGGVVNHASGDVDGAQIGLINVAGGRVRGLQLGLVNVADDVDGVPIGLISVTKSGGIHPVTWASSSVYGNVGVKFATRHTYTMISGHASYAYNRDAYGAGFTLGAHAPVTRMVYFDFDAGVCALVAPRSTLSSVSGVYNELLFYPKVRALAGLQFDKHFSLFAGVGAATEARIYNGGRDLSVTLMPEATLGVQL